MRFLCEQCKAKYQIADEKVAGKTVRMKCRKCGHLIEVKADVTETSVASKAPAPIDEHEEATRIGMDVNAMMKLSAQPPKAAPGKGVSPASPAKPPAPRPGAGAKPGLATSLASAKPAARPAATAKAEGGSALAGAFQKSVTKDDDRGMLEISTSSEWYVAINGVPVGPVRIAELRRKAASGAVHEESLVWQEGMEEWRPLRTVPELVAIVHEGLSSERPSLVTPAPATSGPPRPTGAPRASSAPTKPEPPQRPLAPVAPARSNVVSLSSRLATAEKLEPEEIADPFAAKSPISGIDPFGPQAPAREAAAASSAIGVAAPTVVIPRKNGPNWVVIGMVVAFGAFGATAGVAVFFKQPVQQAAPTVIVTTQAPAPIAAATGGGIASADTITVQPGVDPNTHPSNATVRPQGGGGGATTATQRAVDPSIAALLGGPGGGPSVGGGAQGGSTSSALDADAIQRVVQQRSAGVKRTCWERGGATESNVNVRVHLLIAATGNVQNATAEGNDPIVSKCIENSVRNWQFPVSSGSTNVDIPFHFLRQ